MKKKIIFGIIICFFFLLGMFLFFLENKNKSPQRNDVYPTPTIVKANINYPINSKNERELEANYAKDREVFIKEKPWIILMPLESSNYFVFYDSEEDKIRAKLYYFPSSIISKDEQLKLAKTDVLNTLNKVGVNIEKEKIVFLEKAM